MKIDTRLQDEHEEEKEERKSEAEMINMGIAAKQQRQRHWSNPTTRCPSPGTKMRAGAERNCLGPVLAQIKQVGFGKGGGVAVARAKHEKSPRLSCDWDPPDFIVLGDPARRHADGRNPSGIFLKGVHPTVRTRFAQCVLLGVVQHGPGCAGDGIAGLVLTA